jgi:hypothetical protein
MPLLNESRIYMKGAARRHALKEKDGEIVKYTGHVKAALARARRKGDVPTREDMPSAITVDSHQAGAGMKLAGSALGDAMCKLAETMHGVSLDEFSKVGEFGDALKQRIEEARHVDRSEAEAALKRLDRLKKDAPGAGQIARGALVGAGVGPVASLAWRAAAGPEGRMGRPIVLRTPKGKVALRPHLAHAAHGAVFGGVLPAGRQKLEQATEKQKLKEYLGQSRRGDLRSKIKKHTGL